MAHMIRPWSDQDLEGNAVYVPFFGAFGMAWDDAIAARWSANPLHLPAGGGRGAAESDRNGEGRQPLRGSRWSLSRPPAVRQRLTGQRHRLTRSPIPGGDSAVWIWTRVRAVS